MAGETQIVVVGNLTADPELRFTTNGAAVANLTIASTPRTFNRQSNEWEDGESLFMRCSAWKEMAEHVAATLTKGSRVIAQGRLKQKSYQDREGQQRTSIELEIDEIGPSLRYATASVTRVSGGNKNQDQRQRELRGQQGGQQQGGGMRPGTAGDQQQGGNQGQDAWSQPGGEYTDETPW